MLLYYIFKNPSDKPEIFLTNLLYYLIKNYEETKNVLRKLTNLNVKHFKQEEIIKDDKEINEEEKTFRPDIVGYDEKERRVLIIECKLDSGLTENQPNSYLKSIERDGKLIFLVPKDRIEYIKSKIKEKVTNEDLNRIEILSWIDLVERIEKEAENSENRNLLDDLKQIKDLIKKLDRETMRPLTYDDLDPRNGKLIFNFLKILKKCRDRIERELKEEVSMKRLTWGSSPETGDIGFYFKFNQKDIGGYLHISFKKWAKYEKMKTPFWIKLNKIDENNNWDGKHESVHFILERYEPDRTFEDLEDEDEKERGTLYAITLTPGMEEEEIVNYIVNEIKKLANFFKEIK